MPAQLLNEDIKKQVKDIFDSQLEHPIEIIFFSENNPCETCEVAYQILDEISSLSSMIKLTTYNMAQNPELAERYKIKLVPGYVIVGLDDGKSLDHGLLYSGVPSGYEFSSLIQGILLASKRDSGLKPEIRKELKTITNPIDLKVFVTPT